VANSSVEFPPPPHPRELYARDPAKTLLALDFDGTLAGIADDPEGVRLRPAALRSLVRIADRVPTLICTGRAIPDVLQFLPGVPKLEVIGNHGLNWRLWEQERFQELDWTPPEWPSWRDAFIRELMPIFAARGGKLEHKTSSLSIHYRQSGREWWTGPKAIAWLREHVQPPAALLEGKMVWNVMPLGTSKGNALEKYLARKAFRSVIYWGDEPTDETVFEKKDMPIVGIRVGPGPTAARYRVASIPEVHAWLAELAAWLG
jgi:trehalose 6-phosphate phosphatase